MKKILLVFALSTAAMGFAQKGKMGVQFNTGAHLLSEAGTGLTMNAGFTYNFKPSFGLKLDGGIDLVGQDNLNRLGLQMNLNVISLANKDAKFGLELHAGASLVNNGNIMFTDNYLLRGDDMVALMGGITPSYRVSEHLRILADVTYIPKLFKIDGYITKYMHATVGVAYNF